LGGFSWFEGNLLEDASTRGESEEAFGGGDMPLGKGAPDLEESLASEGGFSFYWTSSLKRSESCSLWKPREGERAVNGGGRREKEGRKKTGQ